ncbi:MAG: hypothetical protein WDN06_13030 [Asticcacaulis sp.]
MAAFIDPEQKEAVLPDGSGVSNANSKASPGHQHLGRSLHGLCMAMLGDETL